MPVKTVQARVLLGWMDRVQAVKYLLEQCYFDSGLSEKQAGEIWRQFKDAVDSLEPRVPAAPQKFSLSNAEKTAVNQFHRACNFHPNVADIVKVNPLDLLVHQLYVVTEISDGYAETVKGEGWLRATLLAQRTTPFRWRGEPNKITYEFPHGEFLLNGPLPPNGRIEIMEGGRLASVGMLEGRMLLGTGYHRSFAYACNAMNVPDAIGKAAVFPVLKSLPFPDSPAAPNHGLRGMLLGTRCPFFADFFDGRLFMAVNLRKKKHYELRVSLELVGVDDDS